MNGAVESENLGKFFWVTHRVGKDDVTKFWKSRFKYTYICIIKTNS